MIKQKIANTIILKASPGNLITRKDDPTFRSTELWLGSGDSPNNYLEIPLDIQTTAEEEEKNE